MRVFLIELTSELDVWSVLVRSADKESAASEALRGLMGVHARVVASYASVEEAEAAFWG